MFCKYCGSQLNDGDVCKCTASQEQVNDSSIMSPTTDGDTTKLGSNDLTICESSVVQKFVPLLRNPKKIAIIVATLIVIVVLLLSLDSKNKLNGTWILDENQIGGGIRLEIENDTIFAEGNMWTYFGQMRYKYEIKSDTELVLRYDWDFSDWPWSFSYAHEIPVRYSINDEGNQLTISWYGTDFVLLDNTDMVGTIGNNGAIVVQKSGSIVFDRKE